MMPYDQENLSISFGSMSIGTDHTYSSNEPNYTHYPCAYGFESSNNHLKSFGLFNFSSSRFPHEVCDLQNVESSNWVNTQFPIHGQIVGRNQQTYTWHVRDYYYNKFAD